LILTKKNLIYFGVALLVGLIASFGLTGLTYHPVSLQVQQDIYAPITPSGGAEPTISPQVIPTQVLPTITTVPTSGNNACCAPLANSTYSSVASGVTSTFAVASELPIGIIGIGILIITIGAFGGSKMRFESSSSVNTVFTSGPPFGIIIAVAFVLITLYIMAVILGSITAAFTSGICTC
jgi:hypothetical protein